MMPVHAGVDPAHLQQAVESILGQSRTVDEIVVVEDGPLDSAHSEVLDRLESQHRRVVRVVLGVNGGAGIANQTGLVAATGDWVMKVDADDISVPHRLATQLAYALEGKIDVCGTAMLEFDGDPTHIVSVRTAPLTHNAIIRRARWNNPINHPTALYRRCAALESGGYPPWRFMQDYGLFARMIANGLTLRNLNAPLVLFRSGAAMTSRRKANQVHPIERELQRELRTLGLVSTRRAMFNLLWRRGFRYLPRPVVHYVGSHLLATRAR